MLVVEGVGRKISFFEEPVDGGRWLNIVSLNQVVDVDVRIEIEAKPTHELKGWTLSKPGAKKMLVLEKNS